MNNGQLVALAVLLGYDVDKTGVIRFTSVIETDLRHHHKRTPNHSSVEERIGHLSTKKYILPIEGEYWASIRSYVSGQEPSFSGEMRKTEIDRLELRDRPLLRIYADGILLPNQ